MNREFPFRRQLAQCSCQVDILRALRSPLASNHKYVINVVLYVHNRTRLNLPPESKKRFCTAWWYKCLFPVSQISQLFVILLRLKNTWGEEKDCLRFSYTVYIILCGTMHKNIFRQIIHLACTAFEGDDLTVSLDAWCLYFRGTFYLMVLGVSPSAHIWRRS